MFPPVPRNLWIWLELLATLMFLVVLQHFDMLGEAGNGAIALIVGILIGLFGPKGDNNVQGRN